MQRLHWRSRERGLVSGVPILANSATDASNFTRFRFSRLTLKYGMDVVLAHCAATV